MPAAIPIIAAAAAMAAKYYFGSVIIGFLVGAAVSYSANALLGPKAPSAPNTGLGGMSALDNIVGNSEVLPIVYGSRRVGGFIVFSETAGTADGGTPRQMLYTIMALCEGEIDEITNVYFNDYKIDLSADVDGNGKVTQGRYANVAYIFAYTGTDTQTACSKFVNEVGSRWTSAHRLQGVAYLAIRLTYSPTHFPSIPVFTADIKVKKVYDPATATTAFSNNPILCLRDYLVNTRYGRGISSSLIDDGVGSTFRTEKTTCDATVSVAGSTITKYTCDGVLDPSENAIDNVEKLLSSCRGMLVFSGGMYKVVIDKEVTPSTFGFDESNIVGEWKINLGNKTTMYNQMRVNFFNPSLGWQSDTAIKENTTYRSQDNGLVLEREIDLPFTAHRNRALYIAEQNLRQSRQALMVEFTATIAGTRCEVGDVVPITHSTPGWDAKSFRILGIKLKNNQEIIVNAREYADIVYETNTVDVGDDAPDSNLPDPFNVDAPQNLEAREELYITRDGLGVKARIVLSWDGDPYAQYHQVEYKKSTETIYSVLPLTQNDSIEILDIAASTYDIRVKTISQLGPESDYSTLQQYFEGLSSPPEDVKGFSLNAINNSAHFSWKLSNDLDVRLGGRLQIRHTPKLTNQTWASASNIGTTIPGNATNAVLPLISGTYMAKFVDSSGNESNTASMVIASNVPNMMNWNVVETLSEATTFTGTKTNMSVSGSVLEFTGTDTHINDLINNNHGELNGNPTFVTGQYDYAIALDGTGDYINCGTSDDFDFTSEDFSVAFWIYKDSNAADECIINRGAWDTKGWHIWIYSDYTIRFFTFQASAQQVTESNPIPTDEWVHVCVVKNSGSCYIYINGVLDNTPEDTHLDITTDPGEELLFGCNASKTGYFLTGKLEKIYIFRTALRDYDVVSLYGNNSVVAVPIGAWTCAPFTFGTYEFPVSPAYTDIGSVQICRVTSNLEFSANNTGTNIDDRAGLVDTWTNWDDTTGFTDVQALLYVSTTDDDPSGTPTWSDWTRLVTGDYNARAFKFKLECESQDSTHQIQIEELDVIVDMPDRVQGDTGVATSSSATTSVTYDSAFFDVPNLSVIVTNMATGDYIAIANESSTGFDINVYNSSASRVVRNFNYIARGH